MGIKYLFNDNCRDFVSISNAKTIADISALVSQGEEMQKLFIFITMLGLLCPSIALAAGEIGVIKTAEAEVFIVRAGDTIKGIIGKTLFEQDILRTGANGSVGAVMKDDTTLSLGPNSELILKEYVFEPKEESFSVLLRMVKGTFIYMSGVIGKLAPDSIRLETPDSTIAVRGTRLFIKVND